MSQAAESVEISGEFRRPRNLAQEIKGSIHDDATASKLGFRGGTVAGSVHMDQFVPALLELYGPDWFRRGTLSLTFKHATVDNEAVRVFAQPGEARARLWMENEAGDIVGEGTGSCGGPDLQSEVRQRLEGQGIVGAETLRILGKLKLAPMGEDVIVSASATKRLDTITEPLPAYEGKDERFAGSVLPPSACVQLFCSVQRQRLDLDGPAVGLYGAIEIEYIDGPLLADAEYSSHARILALSESPKTENLWWEVVLSDPRSGREVARMLQYLRFLKGSSKLYG